MLTTQPLLGYLSRFVYLCSGTSRLGFVLVLGLFGFGIWQGLRNVTEAAAPGHWPAPAAPGFAARTSLIQTSGGCGGRFMQPAGSPFSAGGQPVSVAVGDFNLDNKSDLAVTNNITDNVTILLGQGSGGFIQPAGSPLAVGDAPSSVAVGDFNNDSKPDLAVTNTGNNNVMILLGDGSGGFTQAADSPINIGNSPAFVVIGDFNLDTKSDLALANFFGNNVTVLLGQGNGGFTEAAGSPISVGINPRSIAVGDFDLNNIPDLAVANFSQNSSSGSVTILLGDGSGGFTHAAGSPVGTGNRPFSIARSDFNTDGKLDLAVTNIGSNNVTILLGDGSGGFTQAAGSPVSVGTGPRYLAVSDFNVDGKPDITVANNTTTSTTQGSVTILQGDGNGGFTQAPGSPLTAGREPFAVAVGDFDMNGEPDLAVTNFLSANVTIFINACNSNPSLMFFPLAHPVRLLDTRFGQSACFRPFAPIPGGTSRTQPARVVCDGLTIPADALAITGNITTVQSGGGYLTLYPSDTAQPLVANSNYNPNEILNNVFTVGLGRADGAFKIFVTSNTDVVVDVTGYYAPPGTGGLYFHPLPKPIRLLETRTGFTGCFAPGAPLPGGGETTQQARLSCDGVTIPDTAMAIVGNATTVGPQGPGFPYLTLFPADAFRPLAASSNYLPGQVMNAPFTVGLSPAGEFKIYPTTQTDLVIDVLGYYSADALDLNGAGLLFTPLPAPVRLLETRSGFLGCYVTNAPLLGGSSRTQPARGVCDGATISLAALGIVGNATVVNPGDGYLTFWPGNATQPLVATSNFTAGQVFNRHFTVGLSDVDGTFKIFPSATTDLVIDVSGFFAP